MVMIAAVAMMAAAAASSALGSYKSGQATEAADNYNAEAERIQSTEALDASQAQGQIVNQQTQQKLGTAGAAYGAAGVEMSGSPLEMMSNLASKGELNRRLTLYQGQVTSTNALNQASLDVGQGKMAYSAGLWNAGTTLLTGMANTSYNVGQSSAGTSLTTGSSGGGSAFLSAGSNSMGEGGSTYGAAGGLT